MEIFLTFVLGAIIVLATYLSLNAIERWIKKKRGASPEGKKR